MCLLICARTCIYVYVHVMCLLCHCGPRVFVGSSFEDVLLLVKLQIMPYSKKTCTQNMCDGENIGELSIYVEGIERLAG